MERGRVNSGKPLFDRFERGVYELLQFLDPGLIMDIGAAAGYTTQWMLHFSPESRAKCYEPFPGNWPYIEGLLGQDPRVEIHKKAMGREVGEASFYVKGVVPDGERFAGYSSLGTLVTNEAPTGSFDVPVTTIDAEVDERILFLKVDVQDGELDVFKGAADALERGIDIAFVEYGGDEVLLQALLEHFYVFDHRYVLTPWGDDSDLSSWEDLESVRLTTGQASFYAWPIKHVDEPKAYVEFFRSERERKRTTVYTDLVCIRPGRLDEVVQSLGVEIS